MDRNKYYNNVLNNLPILAKAHIYVIVANLGGSCL